MQKLINKQSAKVICRLDRLRTGHSKSKKATWVMEHVLAAHVYDYIELRINSSLTTCTDLAMMMDNSLSACNASYILPYRYMPGIINLCFYHSHAYYCIAIFMQSAYKSKQTSI